MSQIEELQGRITAAMDRIGTGLGALEAAQVAAQDAAAQDDLTQALDDEKLANAQLAERLKTLKAQLADVALAADTSGDLEALQAEVELLRNEVGNPIEKDALKAEIERLTGDLEAAGNTAAVMAESKATLEAEVAERNADTADGGSAELRAEIDDLKAQLQTAQDELAAAQSAAAQPAAALADGDVASNHSEELDRQNDMLVRLDTELQQLRHANESLRSANTALREANAAGVGDADLINTAMEAEIAGLRAAQASDQAQVNVVLAKLEPLLAHARNLPEGEEV
ncbi:MAG: colicin transporter [Rhodobacteraceae bacterium]|nr:colicin transporter [Paracoccaceae bacterium]